MTNLHDARVEEVAEVMADMNGEPRVGRYERTLAAVALKNADAVVTVEELASEIGRECDCGAGAGSAVCKKVCASRSTALIRGGEEQ